MKRGFLIVLVLVAAVAVALGAYLARGFWLHGVEDETGARLLTLSRLCDSYQPASGSRTAIRDALRKAGNPAPEPALAWLLDHRFPAEVVVVHAGVRRSYLIAAYTRANWRRLEDAALPARISHADWLLHGSAWLRSQEHGHRVEVPSLDHELRILVPAA